MKKPQGKGQDKSKKVEKKPVEDENPEYHLLVDSNDTLEDLDKFFIHPKRLALLQILDNKVFESAVVKRAQVEDLHTKALFHILCKLKVGATLEIIVDNPISISQPLDAKLIEANVKSAGYDNIEISECPDVNDPNSKTLKVTATRPERNPNNVEVELEATTTTTTNSKGKVVGSKTEIKGKVKK